MHIKLRHNCTFRHMMIGFVSFWFVFLIAGCGTTISSNGTQVVVFPTAISNGSPLPTFGGLATQQPIASPLPTTILATAILPSVIPTVPPTPTPVPPTAIPTLDNNWTPIANGVDYRRLGFNNSSGQSVSVLVARIDPTKVVFHVKYIPGQAKRIDEWLLASPGALLVVNANYFDTSNSPIGLVAADGTLYGRSTGRSDSGMFQVVNGAAKVRSLFLEPYNNAERFDQLIQGYPMLMVQQMVAPAFDRTLDNSPNRRTVIAQDVHGRILIMVIAPGLATFTDVAQWLGVSGLEVDSALNLDGGTSTSMYLATGGPSSLTPGLRPVPVVLTVYAR